MVPVIVPAYAAVLAFIYIALAIRVIRLRQSARVAIGTGGNAGLERTIRVHANFAEYVPFALLLATFVEMQGAPAWPVHLSCLAAGAGRLTHAVGVSPERENIKLRVVGMVMTIAVLTA